MSDKSTSLGEFEQLVLLAVAREGDEAWGTPVWDAIVQRSGRAVTLGTVYKTLMRLEEKDLLRSRMGEPTPQRGGRRKKLYTLTAAGRRSLVRSLRALRRMADGLDLAADTP